MNIMLNQYELLDTNLVQLLSCGNNWSKNYNGQVIAPTSYVSIDEA